MTADRYLLDTNILSHLVRHPQGAVAKRIAGVGEDRVCTSIVVACELRFGAAKSGSSKLANQVEAILGAIEVLPFEADADRHYAALRVVLERQGTPIGANDMLIAAHALALGAICVTHNAAEFGRAPSLRVDDWLA